MKRQVPSIAPQIAKPKPRILAHALNQPKNSTTNTNSTHNGISQFQIRELRLSREPPYAPAKPVTVDGKLHQGVFHALSRIWHVSHGASFVKPVKPKPKKRVIPCRPVITHPYAP